jgi:1,4-dihydroxy-2-naphthoate octaprenyltransferase
MVFVFFGLVAVVGTTYVQTEAWSWAALWAAVGVGALACAILVVNNLRDIPTDTVAGKRTLAVVLGDRRTRLLYAALTVPALRTVLGGATGPALVPVLQQTGLAELVWAALVAVALVVAG